jgi:hypothetical protein
MVFFKNQLKKKKESKNSFVIVAVKRLWSSEKFGFVCDEKKQFSKKSKSEEPTDKLVLAMKEPQLTGMFAFARQKNEFLKAKEANYKNKHIYIYFKYFKSVLAAKTSLFFVPKRQKSMCETHKMLMQTRF